MSKYGEIEHFTNNEFYLNYLFVFKIYKIYCFRPEN